MTPGFRSIDELRGTLEERAGDVRVPVGLAQRAMDAGGRIRRRRRAAVVAAAVSAVVGSTFAVEGQHRREPEPATPTPSSINVTGQVSWSATLPGFDLPAGEPLRVPYAVGDSLIVDGQEPVLPGGPTEPDSLEQVVQVTETALGLLVVTNLDDLPVFNLWLVNGQEVREVAGAVELTGMVAVGAGDDGEPRIAFADRLGIREGPLLDPQPVTVVEEGRRAVGFSDGDALFALTDRPGFERLERGPGGSTELLQLDGAPHEDSAPAAWVSVGGETLAIYTDAASGCTTAYRVPGSGAQAWEACDDSSRATMIVGSRYGAVGVSLYDAASGARVGTLELPGAGRLEIAPIGWETPTSVILRVVSYEPYDVEGAEQPVTVPPRYVAVRCAVDTGVCERLPHPVDVIATEVASAG